MIASSIDILDGIARWPMWGRMGWIDIRRRYKRTVLGPFWATLSMGIFIGALGVLWANLWKVEVAEYLPFLTTGFLAWVLITSIITESCLAIVAAEPIIKQLSLPYTVHLMTVVWRNVIIFGHHLVVYAVVFILFPIPINLNMLLFFPGLLVIIINSLWMALVLSIICTRFRDIPSLIASIIQIMMFITPIMWTPGSFSGRKAMIVDLNPAYHLIEILRAPMLGHAPTSENWYFVAIITVTGWCLALLLYRRYHKWIPYWL